MQSALIDQPTVWPDWKADRVRRLGYFWMGSVSIFLTKIALKVFEFLGYFEKCHFLCKKCRDNFYKKNIVYFYSNIWSHCLPIMKLKHLTFAHISSVNHVHYKKPFFNEKFQIFGNRVKCLFCSLWQPSKIVYSLHLSQTFKIVVF